MKKFLNCLAFRIDETLAKIKERAIQHRLTMYSHIHPSVKMGSSVKLIGPQDAFRIGKMTYVNEGIISAGTGSQVIIGSHCAIGYRVSIKAVTHDVANPCPNDKGEIAMTEASIHIGDYCWIGDNVFIREGVTLGSHVTVGANSVVTKSFPDNVTIAGVPAKIISGADS